MKPKDKPHYVNNREFSLSVVEYVKTANAASAAETEIPKVTDYIATCFLKISEGLSHKSNFIRYTYREEMVMDAVENCLKAIGNYNIEAATRSGNPNAFAYFTQICWYAFLRRIAREKKQQDIKMKYMSEADISMFVVGQDYDNNTEQQSNQVIESLRIRIDTVKDADTQFKEYMKAEKKQRKRRAVNVDSDLSDFLVDD